MNISELLFRLCSAWSWPCCTGREPWFSPVSARRFCTPENFFSEEAVCHLPLRSILHDMKLSTQAGRSAFTIRAFVSTIGRNDCCTDIFLYQKPWKNKGLIHMQKPPALKNEEIKRTRHPSEIPAELFLPMPACFTWCSRMSLKRLLKHHYFWNPFYFLAGQSL